ncbi:MAG: carbamate kinase [Acidimicrobiales bacterium]
MSGTVRRSRVVVALGGNALSRAGEAGTFDEQLANAVPMADMVSRLAADRSVLLVHGNGPQVGALALQQEEGVGLVPAQPLFSLDAMTEGHLGSLLALAMSHHRDGTAQVVALVTHVVVDEADPAFAKPTKPIGPYFERDRALALAGQRGWHVQEVPGRGFRRVVPSPEPRDFLESGAIRCLLDSGYTVVAAGGGGVPLVRNGAFLVGTDAVVDKDLAAERLATMLEADALALVTDVDHVLRDYATPSERAIDEMTAGEAETLLAEGQFPAGSMGPKVAAAVRFLRGGGRLAVITSATHVADALAGHHGTRLVAAAPMAVPGS